METYRVETLARSELVQAVSVDESDLHVVRFKQADGRARSFGRGTLVSYRKVLPELEVEPAPQASLPRTAKP